MTDTLPPPPCCTPLPEPLKVPRLLKKGLLSTWAIIVFILALLAIIAPPQAAHSTWFLINSLVHIFPYLLLSAMLGAYLQAARAETLVGKVFAKHIFTAIFFASVFGALSPFCSCGVIPLIAALATGGVPLAAIMSFWVASPIMSPSMFVVTAGGLGLEFALVKTFSAIGIGVFSGLIIVSLQRWNWLLNPLRQQTPPSAAEATPLGTEKTIQWRIWQQADRITIFVRNTKSMLLFLCKWLSLAFVLESLMIAYLPGEWLGQHLGSHSVSAILIAAVLGVPAYLNGFAAVPLVAGLLESGVSRGPALTFMLAGAITSLPAAIAVYSLVRIPLFIWYLIFAFSGSIISGLLYQLIR